MVRKVINKGNWNEIIDDGKVGKIYQTVVEVRPNSVKVVSNNNKEYFVKLSDKVRLTKTINEKDTAVIKTFEKCWLVTDIIPKEKETATGEELQKKIEQERFDSFCLGGDY